MTDSEKRSFGLQPGGRCRWTYEPSPSGPITLSRIVSDGLTAIRFLLSGFMVTAGMIAGPRAITAALISMLVGWMTDILDGPIARLRPDSRRTWISRHDFAADMSLIYSFLLFVVITGLLPVWLALMYVIPGAAITLRRPTERTMMMVAAPLQGVPVVVAFAVGLPLGLCFLAFIAATVLIRWGSLKESARDARQELDEASAGTT